MSAALKSILGLGSVQKGIAYTVGQLTAKWRQYEPQKNYHYRCVVAIWEMLEQVKKQEKKFKTEEDLTYFLFGNRHRKNRVFWAVEKELKRDCGIKDFKDQPLLNFDDLANFIHKDDCKREGLIRKIQRIFNEDHLTRHEKIVLSLHFNLSCEEESRDDLDTRPWSPKEIAYALNISELEVSKILKSGLQKLKPLLAE
jgi:DNA-directed RNA polymerase specialized sigma subunit